ncbi:unnamed protein product [Rotaria sp. Silwood2]|nr:unnamed protein product [Rotaria sp. Silwood2]CAF3131587.1 unnamed protein product [Rotaria sp. Silwood2]CAF3275951.1 unnamed protein product [Rotaria sp. Silwood2]CAF4024687.1 unnamed protein product [Rotaria sp. Silwood2]CAF4071848.1 unnamed protein product [Rotaria sp. Silwood2]
MSIIWQCDPQTPNNHVPTSVLSPTIINTNPTTTTAATTITTTPTLITSTSSLLKNEHIDEYPHIDLNLNFHHHNHLIQQRLSLDQNDDDDDGDDDDDDTNNQNINRNSEISNRIQTTCFRDREIHNRLEKHRRAHLKDCFDSLKAEVPCQRDRKITNLQVLNLAIKYIQTLTRKEREYEQEITSLTSRSIELQNRLGCLKTELNSEGHNVDTWLESCSDIDYSTSTRTASEAEMYRTFDDDDELDQNSQINKKSTDLITNNNHNGTKTNSYLIDPKTLVNNRKSTTRQRPRPSKRKLQSIPTTNLLHTLSTSIPINNNNNNTINNHNTSRSENLLDFNVARHLHLNEPCNLLTNINTRTKDSLSLTPITDIRYDIVDMFTKGTTSHLLQQQQQQQQQISPLPSIASLMNRHSSQPSPIVSPTKQTIGINTDPLTTSTTNILHQSVATS